MDFLLECIGFSPEWDLASVARVIRERGERTAWRGKDGEHLRLDLAGGLELRLDLDGGRVGHPDLWPFYTSRFRRRVGILKLEQVEDSKGDVIVIGQTDPPAPGESWDMSMGHDLTFYLTDAKRLPSKLPNNHVLAVMLAGFALQVEYVGPNEGSPMRFADQVDHLSKPHGASIDFLGAPDSPAACMQLSMRIRAVTHLQNKLTGAAVNRIELDAPGAPLEVFISPWQLEQDGLEMPRPGWRIDGVFLFLGRAIGRTPSTKQRRSNVAFG